MAEPQQPVQLVKPPASVPPAASGAGLVSAPLRPAPGGGFMDRLEQFFSKRQHVWFVGIGAASLVVGFIAWSSNRSYRQQQAAALTSPAVPQSPDSMMTGYDNFTQALMGLQSIEQQNQGLLAQLTTQYQQGINPPSLPPPSPPSLPPPQSSWTNPLIPFGQWPAHHPYSNAFDLQEHPTITWQGTTYKEVPGTGGRLWGTAPNGQQVLLYGPQSAYH